MYNSKYDKRLTAIIKNKPISKGYSQLTDIGDTVIIVGMNGSNVLACPVVDDIINKNMIPIELAVFTIKSLKPLFDDYPYGKRWYKITSWEDYGMIN